MKARTSHGRPLLCVPVIGLAWLVLCGCHLFRAKSEPTAGLPPIQAPRDALMLEVYLVERPADDPLMGSLLWRDIDEVGAVDPGVRKSLRENGLRVGQVGSSPPRALQQLLGMTGEDGPSRVDDPWELPESVSGRRLWLRSGAQTAIQTSRPMASCRFILWEKGQQQIREFESAQCVLQLRVRKVQPGWARLEFLPEIHYGPETMHHVGTAAGFRQEFGQRQLPLYPLRFEMTLNIGEMAVVAADPAAGRTIPALGDVFFRGMSDPGQQPGTRRLVVVRLVEMQQIKPVRMH